MSGRNLFRFLFVVGVIIAIAFGAVRALRPTAYVVAVRNGPAVSGVPATLTVAAEQVRTIVSEYPGRIAKTKLDTAVPVTAGEVIVDLDVSGLGIEMKQTSGDLAAAKERLAIGATKKFDLLTAKDVLENTQRMVTMNVAPKVDLDRAQRGVEQAQQAVDLEEFELRQKIRTLENLHDREELQMQRMSVRSPIDGVVSKVFAFEDSLIGTGTPIAEIISRNRVVEARISEENFADVREGQPAQVRFLPYAKEEFDGVVDKLLPAADTQTQRRSVFLKVKNIAPERLVPGITGEATIELNRHEGALLVPASALIGDRVFVVDDGRIELRDVKVGFKSLLDVEILAGLKKGELVIFQDLDLFREGEHVTVHIVPQ